MKDKSGIVYGAPATGRTQNARAIADLLSCPNIVDDWDGRARSFVPYNTLHITNVHADWDESARRVLSIDKALALLGNRSGGAQ